MTKYSYKGYTFESDRELSEDDWSQTLSHIDTLPPKQTQSKGMQGLGAIEPSVKGTDTPSGKPSDPSLLGKARGVAEGTMSVLAGMPAAVGGVISGLTDKVIDPSTNFEERSAYWTEKYHPKPTTEEGEVVAGKVGKVLEPLNAIMPNLQMMHGITRPLRIAPKLASEAEIKAQKAATAQKEVEAANAQAKAPAQAPVDPTKLPELPADAPPIIPGTATKESLNPVQKPSPLPIIGDELLPIAERTPLDMPIGRVEGGDFSRDVRTPLPELPPQERGLLSLEEQVQAPKQQPSAVAPEAPPVDFPLKQEVLQQPAIVNAVNAFKDKVQALEQALGQAKNGFQRKKIERELEATKQEFADGMRQLGVYKPQDALGLNPLYQTGVETKLPLEKAQSPNSGGYSNFKKGVGGKQGGAIDPSVFVQAFKDFKDSVIKGKNGLLVPLYHGGAALKEGMPTKGSGIFGEGLYLTGSAKRASGYTKKPNSATYQAYVNLRNPISSEAFMERFGAGLNSAKNAKKITEQLKAEGYDGVISTHPSGEVWEAVSFYPERDVKSTLSGASPKEQVLAKDEIVRNAMDDMVAGNRPQGQTSIGRSQRGSIGFDFKKANNDVPSFEEFVKDNRDKGFTAVGEDTLRTIYDKTYPSKSLEATRNKAIGNVPGLKESAGYNKYESRPVQTDPLGEGSVKRMEADITPDLPEAQSMTNKLLSSAGRLQAWKTEKPAVHEGMSFMTSVKEHYRVATEEATHSVNKLLNKFEIKLFGKDSVKDAMDVFELRREHEFDANFDPSTVLSGRKLELFKEIDRVIKDLYQKINVRRKELDPNAPDLPQLPYYFTSFFKGDWAIPVFDRATNQFLFNLRESTRGRANLAKEWLDNHPEFYGKDPEVMKQTRYTDKRMDAHADFQAIMETFGPKDPMAVQALERMTAGTNRTAMNAGTMPQRFMNKAGRIGSLGDKPWLDRKQNYFDNKEALRRYVTGANEWLANTQISKFLEGMEKSEALHKSPNARQLLQDYGDYAIGKTAASEGLVSSIADAAMNKMGLSGEHLGAFARGWSNVSTALLIGWGSARAAVQNVVQPLQATIPKMVQLGTMEGLEARYIPMAIIKGFAEGTLDLGGHWTGANKLRSSTLDYKEAHHIVDAHIVENSGMFKSHIANKIYDFAANKSVAATEQFARSISFSIYRHFLEDNGFSNTRALDMAKNITQETVVNYEGYAKPQIFGQTGIVGELAGRLQTYKVNSATQMYEYASKMKAKDPKSWAAFSTSLSMSMMTAGAMGIIGMDALELMWQGLQAADRSFGEPTPGIQENSPKRYIYDNWHPAASMGLLSHMTGWNVQGAFAQNLVGDNPASSLFPMGGVAVQQAKAPLGLIGGDNARAKALASILPSSAKPIIESQLSTADLGNGEKQVISPTTNETVWKGQGQGYVGHSNIQTLERGMYSKERQSQRGYEMDLNESQKSIQASASSAMSEFYRDVQNNQPTDKSLDKITDKLAQYYDAGGDPNELWAKLVAEYQSLGIGDTLLEKLTKDVTIGTTKKIQRVVERMEKRK